MHVNHLRLYLVWIQTKQKSSLSALLGLQDDALWSNTERGKLRASQRTWHTVRYSKSTKMTHFWWKLKLQSFCLLVVCIKTSLYILVTRFHLTLVFPSAEKTWQTSLVARKTHNTSEALDNPFNVSPALLNYFLSKYMVIRARKTKNCESVPTRSLPALVGMENGRYWLAICRC